MDVERDQKAAAIHQTTDHNWLVGRGPFCVQSCCAVLVLMNRFHTYCNLCKHYYIMFPFCDMQNFVNRMLEIDLKCNQFNVTAVGCFRHF
jgi:hypothetical protein